MHGRERKEYKAKFKDPKIASALAQKALQWNALSKELLIRRKRLSPPAVAPSLSDEDKGGGTKVVGSAVETLKIIDKVLVVNPDPSHLWNHRRELLLQTKTDDEKGLSPSFEIKEELNLTAACLKRNPKAYSAWYHRKWSIRHWISLDCPTEGENSGGGEKLLTSELGLCAEFLTLDERNFHCWNYSRFVVAAIAAAAATDGSGKDKASSLDGSWSWANTQKNNDAILMGPQLATTKKAEDDGTNPSLSDAKRNELLASEWDFTKEKIMNNFSNCSAFHYRSKLLPLELGRRIKDNLGSGDDVAKTADVYFEKLELAREELELVQNAIFTEPDDQTAWWFHRFVVTWASPIATDNMENEDEKAAILESYLELLQDEADSVRELISTEEEGGSGCKWGLLALHMILENLIKTTSLLQEEADEEMREEANECLDKLIGIDPDRATRYESMKQ